MRKLFYTISIIFMSFGSMAQHHEIGPFIGISYYLGDITTEDPLTYPGNLIGIPNYNFGINYRYAMNPRFAIRIAAHYGKVSGDSKYDNENLQYKNLSFHSTIIDIEAGLELNFLEYVPGSTKHRFTPYIYGGLGFFHFNPKTDYMGVEYELQPLGTEGQGLTAYPDKKPYKLTSFALPFGFGFKYNISKKVSIGFEWGLRKTFTDYIDDVSTFYPDAGLLAAEKSPLAAALSNRMNEDKAIEMGMDISIGPNGQPNNPADFTAYLGTLQGATGRQRGGEAKDWYSIAGFTLMFKIVGPKSKGCPAYQKHKYFKEYIH